MGRAEERASELRDLAHEAKNAAATKRTQVDETKAWGSKRHKHSSGDWQGRAWNSGAAASHRGEAQGWNSDGGRDKWNTQSWNGESGQGSLAAKDCNSEGGQK